MDRWAGTFMEDVAMKKSFALLFVAALLLGVAALPAFADEAGSAVTLDDLFAPAGGSCAVAVAAPVEHEDGAAVVDLARLLRLGPGPIGGGQCNQAVCGPDEFCCNYSCSTCAPRGGYCLDVICPPIS